MTIRDVLDAINAGMARALAEQDAKRFASYYTDDARLLSHGQPIIRGRAEIEARSVTGSQTGRSPSGSRQAT